MTGKVTAQSGLRVRSNHNLQAGILKVLPLNTVVEWTEQAEGSGMTWYKSSGGWISADWVEITSQTTNVVNTPSTLANPTANPTINVPNEQELVTLSMNQVITTLTGAAVSNFHFIKGLPYSFPNHVDRKQKRADGTDKYGREYLNTYLCNTPVVTFTPCSPHFLPTDQATSLAAIFNNKSARNTALAALSLSDTDDAGLLNDLMNDIVAKNMQYFTTRSSYEQYFEYVNTLCRMSAIAMGLGSYEYGGVALRNYDWGTGKHNGDPFFKKNNPKLQHLKLALGYDKSVAFAYDPASSISNNVSNVTRESELSNVMKGASAKVREAEFLFGIGAGYEMNAASNDYLETVVPKMSDMAKYDPDSIFGRIRSMGSTVLTGSNFRLPEIYQDSGFGESYSVTMKFRSPYGFPLAVYLDVLVPFWHVFALGGARSVRPNEYSAPFLIRAYSPGYFNVEMGIIDSISWTKFGDGEDITEMGVPLEMEVTVNFKDLYKVLAITNAKNINAFFNNNGLLEMIGTMSGMNMSRADKLWALQTYFDTLYNTFWDAPGNFMGHLQDWGRNWTGGLLGR